MCMWDCRFLIRRSVMSDMRTFPLGVILSITHGALLCEMEQVYEILNFMTGDNLFTHQLPRARTVAAPDLFRQFPDLMHIDVAHVTPKNWKQALAVLEREYGASRTVAPLPPRHYEAKDPIEELVELRGGTKGIIV